MDWQTFLFLTALITTVTAASYQIEDVSVAEGNITTLTALNDLLYFTGGETLHSYSPKTGKTTTIGTILSAMVWSYSTTLNGKLYITDSDGGLYQYDPAVNNLTQVAKVDDSVTTGVTALNGKIYFCTNFGNLYEFDPVSRQTKKVSNINLQDPTPAAAVNGKVYSGGYSFNPALYEVDPVSGSAKLISSSHFVIKVMIAYNNTLYFGADWDSILTYDPDSQRMNSLCEFPTRINPYGLAVLNDVLYIGGYDSEFIWKMNLGEELCEQIPVPVPDKGFVQTLAALNGKLYIGSKNSHLYELSESTDD